MRLTCPIIVFLFIAAVSTRAEEIRIGLLIPDSTCLSAQNAAAMAIQEANQNGGYKGLPFKLLVRTTEGPWGAGSGESVKLVYEDGVCAMMGSLDGRNAHLAEQVAAKAHILFLSAWASDPTLSQAFVPWYFRCIPDDDQQAAILFDAVFNMRHFESPVLITDDSYDAALKLKSLTRIILENKHKPPLSFFWQGNGALPESIRKGINATPADAILIFAEESSFAEIFNALRENNIQIPVFSSILSSGYLKNLDNLILLSPCNSYSEKAEGFIEKYMDLYGYKPGPRAAYAYDGMKMIIKAVRIGGTDPQKIYETMSTIALENGLTGSIQFDEMGNRKGTPCLIEVKNGVPEELKSGADE